MEEIEQPERERPSGLAFAGWMIALLLATGATLLSYRFKAHFESMNVELPFYTTFVLDLADFFDAYWFLPIPVALASGVAFWRGLGGARATRVYAVGAGLLAFYALVVVPLAILVPIAKLQASLDAK
jgi:hypothetical protein